MKISPKTEKEALKLVYDILNQGDSRYNSAEDEIILSKFIMSEAVELEEKSFPSIDKPETSTSLFIQGEEKYISKQLLKLEGFKDTEIFFERLFSGSRTDVLAESPSKIVTVECCSCRIDKIISYLNNADEVWVVTKGLPPYENFNYLKSKMQWFVFKKGKNWNKVLDFQNSKQEELRKINSPFDNLRKH